jgi:hypothetical protein
MKGKEQKSEEEERGEKINLILKQTAVLLLLRIYLYNLTIKFKGNTGLTMQ